MTSLLRSRLLQEQTPPKTVLAAGGRDQIPLKASTGGPQQIAVGNPDRESDPIRPTRLSHDERLERVVRELVAIAQEKIMARTPPSPSLGVAIKHVQIELNCQQPRARPGKDYVVDWQG